MGGPALQGGHLQGTAGSGGPAPGAGTFRAEQGAWGLCSPGRAPSGHSGERAQAWLVQAEATGRWGGATGRGWDSASGVHQSCKRTRVEGAGGL